MNGRNDGVALRRCEPLEGIVLVQMSDIHAHKFVSSRAAQGHARLPEAEVRVFKPGPAYLAAHVVARRSGVCVCVVGYGQGWAGIVGACPRPRRCRRANEVGQLRGLAEAAHIVVLLTFVTAVDGGVAQSCYCCRLRWTWLKETFERSGALCLDLKGVVKDGRPTIAASKGKHGCSGDGTDDCRR